MVFQNIIVGFYFVEFWAAKPMTDLVLVVTIIIMSFAYNNFYAFTQTVVISCDAAWFINITSSLLQHSYYMFIRELRAFFRYLFKHAISLSIRWSLPLYYNWHFCVHTIFANFPQIPQLSTVANHEEGTFSNTYALVMSTV